MIATDEIITIGFFSTPRTTGIMAPIFIFPLSALWRALLNKFRNIAIITWLKKMKGARVFHDFLAKLFFF
ncbi:MAG: hypothetical protein II610_08005 [Treponema sp.]|nr:hypothetical protein [Treponema sp.]